MNEKEWKEIERNNEKEERKIEREKRKDRKIENVRSCMRERERERESGVSKQVFSALGLCSTV